MNIANRPNTTTTLIGQHKRMVIDQDGTLNKIQILRHIRKNKDQPSFLKDPQQFYQQQKQNIFITGLRWMLLATIVIVGFILIFHWLGIPLNVNPESKIGKEVFDSFKSFNFSGLNFNSQNKNKMNENQDQRKIQRLYERFENELSELAEQNENKETKEGIRLNDFKNNLFRNNEEMWDKFISKMTEGMECRMEMGKMICEKQLKE